MKVIVDAWAVHGKVIVDRWHSVLYVSGVANQPDLLALYEELGSLRAVGRRIGLSATGVRNRLLAQGAALRSPGPKRGNSNARRLFLREDYFAAPSGEAGSYLLGVLTADGWVTQNAVALEVSETDRVLVEWLRGELCAEAAIRRYVRAGKSPLVRLMVHSRRMVADLGQWGLHARKSLTLQFPTLPDEMLPAYVRGYFDGDGCALRVEGKPRSYFCGTPAFLGRLHEILREKVSVQGGSFVKTHCGGIVRLQFASRDSIRLAEWMYHGATLYLPRKRAKLCAS